MTDQTARLKAALADRYTIERELGSGGMATVYLAEDLKHRRQVAIKVLRPELAASLGVDRFVREIEIAAKLTHPHILPLFDSGSVEDPAAVPPYRPTTSFLYYVMPFIEGESLRDRLDREGKLDIKEAIRLTDQVASALTHAHERGLVHRDIKPENILLAGDQAIVADFGIARAVQAAGGERLTGTGLAIGTPAYMSPEQAMGDKHIDARSDVYALGCVVHEMVTGHAPFEGATPQELLAKHAVDTVPSLRTRDPKIPLFLERAVARALAKTPDERFQSASAFAEALTSELVVARVGGRRWPRRVAAGAAVVVVLVGAWALFALGSGSGYERLAVLPPTNLMNDPEQAYFVQGVHNALIAELQKAGVKVIARTSLLQYENTQQPIREIAQELDVDALIEASVMRAGDTVEIEVNVVDGRTEQYVADPIVRSGEFRNIVALYRELAGAVASEVRVALSPQAEARVETAREVNPEAYEAYLRGQFYAGKLTPPDLETALDYFERARDLDPDYALAYAGIGLLWAFRQQMGIVPPSEAAPQARAAVAKALTLDSTLVEVQYTLAIVRTWTDWDWEAAEAAFRRAIELNPNFPDVRAYYSNFLSMMRRQAEARPQIERAVELDPFNPLLQMMYGWSLYMDRRFDDAIARFQNVLRIVPNNPAALSGLQKVYGAQRLYEDAVAVTRALYTFMGFVGTEEALAHGLAAGGYQEALRAAADYVAALSSEMHVPPVEVASLYAMAGEDSLALDWLERGFEVRDPDLPCLSAPVYDGLREDPRFVDLARRMRLPH